MPTLEVHTVIEAPIERCFDLSRSVDLHTRGFAHTEEEAIAGVRQGLIGADEEVTWRAKHFGLWWTLRSRITAYQRPQHFQDRMVEGIFRYFEHDHYFSQQGSSTHMRDLIHWEAPFGVLGSLADACILRNYLKRLILRRNQAIKQAAETEDWRSLLAEQSQ